MAGHPLSYEPYPGANPTGAPGGDYEHIQASPDMFGAQVGRAVQGLGQAVEGASNTGFNLLEQKQEMTDKTHAAELHSWFSDQATDETEKFLELKGRAAKMALPDHKAKLDSIFNDALGQASDPYTRALVQTQTRSQMDRQYGIATSHAAKETSVWQARTAADSAKSYGNEALLFAGQGDLDTANKRLFQSDQEVRNLQSTQGYEGPALDAEVAKNRGSNVKSIVAQISNDEGANGGMMKASDWYRSQRDQIDAGSRVQIENYLKGGLSKIAGEKIADEKMGRPRTAQSPLDIATRFVGADENAQRDVLTKFIGRIGGQTVDPSTTAWCAAFVNGVLREAGIQGTGSLAARSFLNVGQPVDDKPQPGDVVVLSRGDPNGNLGHVGFYVGPGATPGSVRILAGNQNDKVGYGEYPAGQVLGVRRVTASDIGQTPTIDARAGAPLRNKGDVMLEIMHDYQDRPQVQAAALAHLNKVYEAYHLQQTQDSAAFKVRLNDSTTEALSTGQVQAPIQHDEFINSLGAEKGEAAFREYQANVQMGADTRAPAGLSPSEIQAMRGRYAPQPGEGYAAQSKRADDLDKAIDQNYKALNSDPAGFLIGRTDGGAAAWKSFQHLMADPHANPAMRQQYADIYAEQMRALQGHAGLDPQEQSILPKYYAANLAARWRMPSAVPAANGQPGGASAVLAEINTQAHLWGDNWPKVYAEIAPKLDPTLRVVAAGVAPAAGVVLLNSQHVKEADLFGTQDDATKQIFGKAVTDALKPFFATLSGADSDKTRTDYETTTRKLAALNIVHGNQIDATTAATQAVSDLLAFKYDMRGTMRIPKLDGDGRPLPFTGDDIEAGAAAAKAALGDLDIDIAKPAGGVSGDYARRNTVSNLQRDGIWMTAAGERGLKLVMPTGEAWPSKSDPSKAFVLTWAQLAQMGHDRSAYAATQMGAYGTGQ